MSRAMYTYTSIYSLFSVFFSLSISSVGVASNRDDEGHAFVFIGILLECSVFFLSFCMYVGCFFSVFVVEPLMSFEFSLPLILENNLRRLNLDELLRICVHVFKRWNHTLWSDLNDVAFVFFSKTKQNTANTKKWICKWSTSGLKLKNLSLIFKTYHFDECWSSLHSKRKGIFVCFTRKMLVFVCCVQF